MMTREEILSIEEYCAEHKISHKKRLEELGIPFWSFYKAKQKYRRADEQDAQPGQFVQLASGRYVPQTMLVCLCIIHHHAREVKRVVGHRKFMDA